MTSKIEISAEEFKKKVEIEYSFLMYMEHMKKNDAKKEAENYIGEKFTIKEK